MVHLYRFIIHTSMCAFLTVLRSASGLFSSCSVAALLMALSVSSCRCLASPVGDCCSIYSGSCWGAAAVPENPNQVVIFNIKLKVYVRSQYTPQEHALRSEGSPVSSCVQGSVLMGWAAALDAAARASFSCWSLRA